MHFDAQHLIGSLMTIGVVLLILYRRVRRNFGRQRLNRGYMIFRMVLLCVLGALLLIPTFFSREVLVMTLIGGAIGLGLAIWAAKHTRFLKEDGVLYYIPHSYTGIVVTALFVGRLMYRVVVLSQSGYSVATMDTHMGPGDLGGMGGIYHNPVTRLIFFVLIGYYVYYYWFVLRESKNLKPEDMETLPATPGGNI
ncbi:MAG TPA: hypothetical protein VLV87_00825 [Gammaproteobacteria bacterium]|nr:hypothetical protein [Gammaproteobacteria bacterium]